MLLEFDVCYDGEWWCASAEYIDQNSDNFICTQGKSIGELVDRILEATTAAFLDGLNAGKTISIVATCQTQTNQPPTNINYRMDLCATPSSC